MPKLTVPVALVALAALIVGTSVVAAPASRLAGYPLSEDGFYSLAIARHIGLGQGVTIDGATWTNGFQPLWVVLVVPVYSWTGGDRMGSLRGVLALSWLLWIATAWAVGELAVRMSSGRNAPAVRLCSVTLYTTTIAIFNHHFNGLETGLLLLIFALIGCLSSVAAPWTARRVVGLAALCGLLVLTRIDAGFFVVLFVCALAVFPSRDRTRARMVRAAIVAAGAALLSAPWWAYNLRLSGSVLPSSGSAVFDWHWKPGRALALSMYSAAHAVPLPIEPFWPWHYEWFAAALLVAAALVGSWKARGRAGASFLLLIDDAPWRFAILLAVYVGFLVVVYAVSPAWWMYERYTAPLVVVSVPALAIVLSRWLTTPLRLTALAAIGAGMMLAAAHAALHSPSADPYRAQLRLVERHVPGGERVGAFQSGTLGYFRDGVVNLDGKVNIAALAARGHMADYARTIGLCWVADWPHTLQSGFGSLDEWDLVERVSDPACAPCAFALYVRRQPATAR